MALDIWVKETMGYSYQLTAGDHPTVVYPTAIVTPVVEHWLELEIAQWVHQKGLIQRPIIP